MPENDSIYLKAIRRQPVARTPLWIMRQAGRYLPEYRKLRSQHDFLTVCKTPDLAAEVTLQPIRRFGFDAAILFSDILVIPEAMGQKLEFLEDHGPKLSPQILANKDISALTLEHLEDRLEYVSAAIRTIRAELGRETPLIGFSGSPFTLATYMIEGKPTRNFKHIKSMLYREPDRLTKLLEILTDAVSRYLTMQIKAGVQAVQIFDTWGGILPVHLYESFSARHMTKVINNLASYDAPKTLFSKGGIDLIRQLKYSKADMLGVDWMTDMKEARSIAGSSFALQGNLDPTTLYGSMDIIKREVDKILDVFDGSSGHVFNLGHGILPDIPVDNVQFLVDHVRMRSEKLHARHNG
ncbi:MAG: uroporphyrinogen decarboxylase [Candidatus Krumholzibacteria bacterium]|nr:uroporphyrinogen decarboxylase [Candidatus Krumholzibacteria bacterium]